MEGADLVNVALGALINLAEHAPEHRARFASVPLRGGGQLLALLCRVLQASLLTSCNLSVLTPRRSASAGCVLDQQRYAQGEHLSHCTRHPLQLKYT